MIQVAVVGRERKFRALVRAELRERGFEALGLETLDEVGLALGRGEMIPAAIVFDLTSADDPEGDLAKLGTLARSLPVIVLATHPALADSCKFPEKITVLHRPVSVGEVVEQVCFRLGKP